MSGSYFKAYAKCPFYRADDGRQTITCEGITDDSVLKSYFRNKRQFELQLSVFCCDKFKNCEIHTMLEGKYNDG